MAHRGKRWRRTRHEATDEMRPGERPPRDGRDDGDRGDNGGVSVLAPVVGDLPGRPLDSLPDRVAKPAPDAVGPVESVESTDTSEAGVASVASVAVAMRPVVAELVRYYRTHEVGPALRPLLQRAGRQGLYFAAGKLLAWLRVRGRGGPWRLWLDPHLPSPCLLRDAIADVPALADLFLVTGDELDFRPEVSAAERGDIEDYVRDRYHPSYLDLVIEARA